VSQSNGIRSLGVSPGGLGPFRQFGRTFATTMPPFVSKGETQSGDDACVPRRGRGLALPYDNEALKQVGSRARRFISWCRGQVFLGLFGLLIFFQVMTWLEIKDAAARHSSAGCGREYPCRVIIDDQARRIIDNDDLARRIGEEVAKKVKR
jgi:hypothetical protein